MGLQSPSITQGAEQKLATVPVECPIFYTSGKLYGLSTLFSIHPVLPSPPIQASRLFLDQTTLSLSLPVVCLKFVSLRH